MIPAPHHTWIRPEWAPANNRPGWIVTGHCGGRHLVGAAWSWWRCSACRKMTTHTIRSRDARRLELFYPPLEEIQPESVARREQRRKAQGR